jgi:hypothetical protein
VVKSMTSVWKREWRVCGEVNGMRGKVNSVCVVKWMAIINNIILIQKECIGSTENGKA